jgi:hypothetical protein
MIHFLYLVGCFRRFSYTGPTVSAISAATTNVGVAGGIDLVTITGNFFGRSGTKWVSGYQTQQNLYPDTGVKICANTACDASYELTDCTVSSDIRMVCNMPDTGTIGYPLSTSVFVTLANMTGVLVGGAGTGYIPAAPRLGSISGTTPAAGGTVTIQGTNLGNYAPALGITVIGSAGLVFSCTNIVFVIAHLTFTCLMGPGSGLQKDVVLTMTQGAFTVQTTSIGLFTFGYAAPIVTRASDSPTGGGFVTIFGCAPCPLANIWDRLGNIWDRLGNIWQHLP